MGAIRVDDLGDAVGRIVAELDGLIIQGIAVQTTLLIEGALMDDAVTQSQLFESAKGIGLDIAGNGLTVVGQAADVAILIADLKDVAGRVGDAVQSVEGVVTILDGVTDTTNGLAVCAEKSPRR